jgi:hypothetical protein
MDGVPMVTQCPIPSSTTFQYKFRASRAGTHMWHAHTGICSRSYHVGCPSSSGCGLRNCLQTWKIATGSVHVFAASQEGLSSMSKCPCI